jgi:serine phosphatase RsbU (regulator of sigma subunit)
VPGVTLAARYRAAVEHSEIGGDFYDVHGEADDWSVVMGDVCGKGVEAAVLTGQARTAVRTAALSDRAPSHVLRLLNAVLLDAPGDAAFATVVCARLRPNGPHEGGLRLDLASAGHPPALLRRAADGAVTPLCVFGMPAGLFPGQAYEELTTFLAPGDVVLFYTDGVLEARGDGGEYGAARLARVVAGCAGTDPDPLVDTVVQDVLAHLRGGSHDDIAVLALQAAP